MMEEEVSPAMDEEAEKRKGMKEIDQEMKVRLVELQRLMSRGGLEESAEFVSHPILKRI